MPISEYEKDERESPCGTPVIVKIHSTQRDMTGTGFFGEAAMRGDTLDDMLEDAEERNEETEPGTYELTTEGYLFSGERISVSYKEAELSEDGECITEISFQKDDPGCITITRSGSLSAAFVIEEGKRQYSVYNTPYGALEMCVYARRVENSVSESGGALLLDYAVELKGMTAQRTKMRVKVTTKEKK